MAPQRFSNLSIRHKLLALVLLPLAGVLPLLGLLLLWWSNQAFDQVLITKVRADLAVANGYFEGVLGEVGASTAALADSHALHLALARPDAAALVELLRRAKNREGLDFVGLRAADGRLRFSDSGAAGETDAPVLRAAADGSAHTSNEVLQSEDLAVLGPALRARVDVESPPSRSLPRAQSARGGGTQLHRQGRRR
jgi:hypothetical protein